MKILLINHYAGSKYYGMEYRPYYLAREWVRMGHTVTIAAASESHVRTLVPVVKRAVTQETIDGICYLWFKTPSYKENGISRAINIFSFVGQLLLHWNWLSGTIKPDIVISSSTYPLDIIPARVISWRNNAKLVFEVHDLWPLSPIELGGMSRHHPFIVLMQWAENYAYRHADWVVSILPNAKDYMQAHGMYANRFVYIPNGVDISEWDKNSASIPHEHIKIIAEHKLAGRTIIGYAGTHGLANALGVLIDVAELLHSLPIIFILIGNGPNKEYLQSLVAQRGLTNMLFLPAVSKNAIPSLLREMDVLYLGWRKDTVLYRFGISPNKLMDYMMSEKPVIHAVCAGNDPVADSGCGISVPPEDAQAIADAVLALSAVSPEERLVMGRRGRTYVVDNHDYCMLAKKFLETVCNTCRKDEALA